MSSEIPWTTLIALVELAVGVIILLYAAYTAFTVRRGLVVPLYRSRALWLGVLAILLASLFIFLVGSVLPSVTVALNHHIAGLVFYGGVLLPTFVVLLVWIDRTNETLIRLDYRRRDILGWKKVRLLYYVDIALFAVFYVIFLGPAPGYGYYQSSVPHTVMSFVGTYGVVLLLIALAYGSFVLVVGSIRTRDLTFRNHVKWLGPSLGTVLLAIVMTGIAPPVGYFIWIIFAYCWYRMARSLVPFNKLQGQRTPAE